MHRQDETSIFHGNVRLGFGRLFFNKNGAILLVLFFCLHCRYLNRVFLFEKSVCTHNFLLCFILQYSLTTGGKQ